MSFWKGLFGKDAPKQQAAIHTDINEDAPSEVSTKNIQDPNPIVAASAPTKKEDRVVRVFISSTFRDMMAERDYLVKFTFPQLRKLCESRGVTWGEVDLRWGVTDEQSAEGKVLPICMEEIKRCRPYFIGMLGERYGWMPDSVADELLATEPWLAEQCNGRKSVTELEILHGVLNDPGMAGHAFFYFRDPRKSMEVEAKLEQEASYQAPQPESAIKLTALKEHIRQSGFPVREDYPTPEDLGALVLADLTKVINGLYPEGSEPEPLDREAIDHEIYARSRAQVYIGREEYFDRLDEHAAGLGEQPLTILGESGSGKSALLANWAIRYREQHPDAMVIQHYIGASPYSADWTAMVRRIMGEFKRKLNIDAAIPSKPDELRDAFPVWLHMAAAQMKVILIIDALNQLEDTDDATDLRWLPTTTHPNLRLFVSTLPGRPLEAINQRGWPVFPVVPLDVEERKELINEYLKVRAKSLEPVRVDRIATAPQTANPLFLRVLLSELCVWGVYERLDERIDHYLEAENPYKLYEKVLIRWEDDYEGDSDLVGDALSMIWAARRGISESELLEALGNEAGPLPRAQWSPLYLAMSDGLVSRNGLLTFAHDYLRTAAHDAYIPNDDDECAAHLRLADYFYQQEISPRQADELPWLLWKAEAYDRLRECILDIDRFLLIKERDQQEVMSYWVCLKEERVMGKAYIENFEKWSRNPSLKDNDISNAAKNLGFFLDHAALYAEAEPLIRLALRIDEKTYGPDHTEVAIILNNLVALLIATNRMTEAEPLIRRALAISEKNDGKEHPNVASFLSNLANLLQTTNRHKEAEPLMRRALYIWEKSYGKEHPLVGKGLNYLAVLLHATNQLEEAEPLMRRALSIAEKSYGPDHPDIAGNLYNIASLLHDTNQLAEAEYLMRRALNIDEKSYGPDHPNVAKHLNNLATILYATNRFTEAESLMRRALSIAEKSYGPDHPDIAGNLNNLAQLLQASNRLVEAEALMRRALSIAEKSYGPDHPDVANKLNNIAALLMGTKRLAEAEPLMRRNVEIFLKFTQANGQAHPHLETAINNYASLIVQMGLSENQAVAKLEELANHYGLQLGG